MTGNGTKECWEFDPGISDVNEYESQSIQAWLSPNPVTGKSMLHWSGEKSSEYSIEIFNAQGGKVKNIFTSEQNLAIFNSEFPCGVYFVRIRDRKTNYGFEKFVMQ